MTSDVALGQVALLSGAGIVLALLLLQTPAWLAAAPAAALAALQPNLAFVLIARAWGPRAWIAFALGFGLFAAAELAAGGGIGGFARYLGLLRVHGEAERYAAIQISPAAIAFGFGAGERLAGTVQFLAAAAALLLAALAIRATDEGTGRVGIAICALPFVVPFFHEHDFLIALFPAIVCAVRARGPVLALAALAAVACGVDWLGLGQRPAGALQSTLLALAAALGFALAARLRKEAWAGLAVALAVAGVSFVAHAHPVPIWPDALPPHWQAPPDASISAVWELEQRLSGLAQPSGVWAFLRICSLAAVALLGFALHLTLRRRAGAG